MKVRTIKAGEEVFCYGEFGHELFIILNGRVSVNVPTKVYLESQQEFFDALISRFNSVIWKSIEDSENVRFHVEGIMNERERMGVNESKTNSMMAMLGHGV